MLKDTQSPLAVLPTAQIHARVAVHEFSKLSYNAAFWEKLVGSPAFPPYGCLVDILNFQGSDPEREQVVFSAAQALRATFPQFTNSKKNWLSKRWDDIVADQITEIVHRCIQQSANLDSNHEDESDDLSADLTVQTNGFFPWRAFCRRSPVSNLPGVYLISIFNETPKVETHPLDNRVVYIGIAEGQSTGARLQQFEQTALGGTGHSGGFTFRTELVPEIYKNNLSLLRRFHNIYCSWIELRGNSPREMEERLLREYSAKWGRWPVLNKKG